MPEIDPFTLWASSTAAWIGGPIAFVAGMVSLIVLIECGAKFFWGWFFLGLTLIGLAFTTLGIIKYVEVSDSLDPKRIASELTRNYSFGVSADDLEVSGILEKVGRSNSIVEVPFKDVEGNLTRNDNTGDYENSAKSYSFILDGRVLEIVEKETIYYRLNNELEKR